MISSFYEVFIKGETVKVEEVKEEPKTKPAPQKEEINIDKFYETLVEEIVSNQDKLTDNEVALFTVLLAEAKIKGLTDRETIRSYMMGRIAEFQIKQENGGNK